MKSRKIKYKPRIQKAELGLQQVEVPQAMNFGDVLGNSLGLASPLAQIGGNFGPLGKGIGFGVGAIGGLIKGLINKRDNKIAIDQANLNNKYYDEMKKYDIEDTLYANDDSKIPTYKKGTRGIKVKYKSKTTASPANKSSGAGPDSYSMFYRDTKRSDAAINNNPTKYKGGKRKVKYKTKVY